MISLCSWSNQSGQAKSKLDRGPLVIGTSSGNGILRENGTLDTNRTLLDNAIAPVDSPSLEDQAPPQHSTGSRISFQEDTAHNNGEAGTSLEPVEAWHEDRKPKSIQPEAETLEAEQRKGKQKEADDPEAIQLQTEEEKAAKLAELKERGKREAEEREANELKLAMPQRLSYYRLFGEYYVHGMMNGEATALQNSKLGMGQMEAQVFELR